MIQKSVTIAKENIEPVGKMKGCVNSDSFEIDGIEYGPRTMEFKGFAGAVVTPEFKLYAGVYRFEKCDPKANAQMMSVKSLPCWSGAPVEPVRESVAPRRIPLEKPEDSDVS